MTQEERAMEFEALVCETNAIGIEVAGMKALNEERTINGYTPGYNEQHFFEKACEMREMAKKFRELKSITCKK